MLNRLDTSVLHGQKDCTIYVSERAINTSSHELYEEFMEECTVRNIEVVVCKYAKGGFVLDDLSMLDMNSLNAIAGFLRCIGYDGMANVLTTVQAKATKMIKERDELFTFSKTVNVTNKKNILVQVPKAVATDWGLEIGDKLEVVYNGDALTISPSIQRGSDASRQSN